MTAISTDEAVRIIDTQIAMLGRDAPIEAKLRALRDHLLALRARCEALEADAARLDYIERTFAAVTTQERYLPLRMIWGKGCNGRTLREACDKYMARDAARTTTEEGK